MERRLGLVFAHPDDETFAVGGILAAERERGTHVALFCATDGDAGKSSGIPVSSRAELGRIRRRELHDAARVLGIAEVVTAGHPDGALGAVEADLLVGEIVRFLRAARPEVVITFGPEGAPTGHRDHRAISRAATEAWFLAGVATSYPEAGPPHAPRRLLYVTWDPPRPGAELQLLGQPAHVRVDTRRYHDVKRAAFHAHASQRQHEPRFVELALTDAELLSLAAGVPFESLPASDFFA
ncbi:MAG TPA: PIG-L family deacetylase [Gemmatimonadaceae bacterium]